MSWYVEKVGKREAVRKSIAAETQIPDPVKSAILSVLGDERAAQIGVKVKGSGHTYTGEGSANSNISSLEVHPFHLIE